MNHTQYDYDKLFLAYEESRADITAHFRKIMELEREIEKLKKQNEIMKKILSFYSDDINWNETEPGFLDRIDSDDYSKVNLPIGYVGGKRARQALKDVDTL